MHCANSKIKNDDFKYGKAFEGSMAIRDVKFSNGDTKLEKIFSKNQHTQRKLLNFEFWINGELSKIGHHFCNKVI